MTQGAAGVLPVRTAAFSGIGARLSGSGPVSAQPGPSLFGCFFSGFNICLALISGAEAPGTRGMQAFGLPVYSEGFLQCRPPRLPGFLSRIFHIFALAVVLGTGHRPGTREPPVAFLNSFLQHTSSLSYSPVGI